VVIQEKVDGLGNFHAPPPVFDGIMLMLIDRGYHNYLSEFDKFCGHGKQSAPSPTLDWLIKRPIKVGARVGISMSHQPFPWLINTERCWFRILKPMTLSYPGLKSGMQNLRENLTHSDS
jgi:hypothetical protein